VARRVWHVFLQSRYKFCGHYERRGTMLVSGREFIPVQKCFKRVVARSRYRHYGFVFVAEVKAKTVTSLLPQPSVL
jgi:hypothetical protein